MTTTRLAPAERKAARRYATDLGFPDLPEPALGTLAQRLDIIRHRFGPIGITLTKAERAQLEEASQS
jgi:hypothetical protein